MLGSVWISTVHASRQRLRPILMNSLAFILGVLPLAISRGAGSGGQNAIGTGVIGGMLSATVLAIFLVPVFFVVMRRLVREYKSCIWLSLVAPEIRVVT
jgi:multidrug efflux pump